MCTAVVAIAFEAIAVATALPSAARELNGLRYYAWAFSTLQVGILLATVTTGRLADRIGPARPMIAGLAIFAVGLVVAATSTTMAQLIAGRLVQGLGSGTIGVSITVCIARLFEPRLRPRMFTYISTAWVLPAFFGPSVSAWLTQRFGWPWVFWAVLPLVAFAAVMVVPSLLALMRAPGPATDGPPATRPPAALWAAALAAAAVVSLQLAGQRLDTGSILLVVAGVVLLAASLPNLMPLGFFRFAAGLPAVVVVRALIAGSFFGAEAFIPLMLVEQRGLTLLLAGTVLTVGSVGWTTGSWLQARPRLSRRRDRIITAGAGLVASGLALTVLAASVPTLWAGLVGVGWVVSGLGMGLAFSSTSVAAMTLSAPVEQGRNSSSLALGEALGGSLLVGLSGTIFATLHPSGRLALTFGWVLGAMAVMAVVATLFSLRIGRMSNELHS
jgi:MFS family permease